MDKTIKQLKQEIATAATTGDDVVFSRLIKEYNSRKADVAKAIQEAAQKEAEALAGVREKLAIAIHKYDEKFTYNGMNLSESLASVKATGYTHKLDYPDINGVMTILKSVVLAVPTIKAAKTSKTHNSTGNRLEDDYQAFATNEDKAKIAAIEANVAAGVIDARAANSKKWVVKNSVRKAAIAAGKLQPIK